MRKIITGSAAVIASGCLGTALSIGNYSYPIIANALLAFAALFYIVAFITLPPVMRVLLPWRERKPMLSTIVAAIIGAVIFAGAWNLIIYLKPTVVTISPNNSFSLYSGAWFNTTSLLITNNSDAPIYSVWVEIWSDNQDIDPARLKVGFDNNPNAIILGKGSGFELNTDIFGLITSEPRRANLFRFYEILPKQSRHITVTGTQPIESKAFAAIRGYRDTPEALIERKTPSAK